MNYIIRLATIEDCKPLSILKQIVWNETYRGIYNNDIIDNFNFKEAESTFINILNNNNVLLYVVQSSISNELVGFMSVGEPIRKYKQYEQEIGLLYLKKNFQKIGLGKKLFNMAKQQIKADGYKQFFVSCNKYNTNARTFYEKMGGKLVNVDEDQEDKRPVQVKYHFDIN